MEFPVGSENESGSTSVPDAWVYSSTLAYCVLIEAKVGTYPLDVGQLEAHARDWFGSDLDSLRSGNSLCSVTWVDVLEALRDASNEHYPTGSTENRPLSHMEEFLDFYGYRLFEGFDFSDL
jgi:hypothetical protein